MKRLRTHGRLRRPLAVAYLSVWLAGAVLALAQMAAEPASEPEVAAPPPGPIVHIRVDSIIHPVSSEFIRESLEKAEDRDASLFVVELSTPGGLLDSTDEITQAILNADVPVAVWVGPSGAKAASAGFFILMAGDLAVMAPGTNTGAAHPVGGQGEDIEGNLGEKVEQDAAANIRSLASHNGRNEEAAEAAVLESRSYTADEALEAGLIDFIAADLDELTEKAEGRLPAGGDDESAPLQVAGARVDELEMSPVQRFLATIAHPNIAYILMTLGGLGLYFELSNPGAILPGVIGGICLILAFFALSVLPVRSAGIALILLAMLFFIAEVKVVSYGLLTVAGLVSLVLGSLMLFRSADPAIRVGLDVIGAVVVFSIVVVGFLSTMAIRAHRSQVTTGQEGLVHERGVARERLAPRGRVFVHGEIWNARTASADSVIEKGAEVEVVAVDGMNLTVRPCAEETENLKGVQL